MHMIPAREVGINGRPRILRRVMANTSLPMDHCLMEGIDWRKAVEPWDETDRSLRRL